MTFKRLALLSAVIFFFVVGRGPAMAAATPSLPFLYDLDKLQPKAVSDLRSAHRFVTDQTQLAHLDQSYDDLVASVNGFLKGIADDLDRNDVHPDRYPGDAQAVMDQAKSFNAAVTAAELTRRQAAASTVSGLKKAHGSTRGGILQGLTASDGKPMTTVDFSGFVFDLMKHSDELKKSRLEEDQKERSTVADELRKSFWPDTCAMGLEKAGVCPAKAAHQ